MRHRVRIIATGYYFTRSVCGSAALNVESPDRPNVLFDSMREYISSRDLRGQLPDVGSGIVGLWPTGRQGAAGEMRKERLPIKW